LAAAVQTAAERLLHRWRESPARELRSPTVDMAGPNRSLQRTARLPAIFSGLDGIIRDGCRGGR
jgi:hypothetical protein